MTGAVDAVTRGWDAIVFDGPGSGSRQVRRRPGDPSTGGRSSGEVGRRRRARPRWCRRRPRGLLGDRRRWLPRRAPCRRGRSRGGAGVRSGSRAPGGRCGRRTHRSPPNRLGRRRSGAVRRRPPMPTTGSPSRSSPSSGPMSVPSTCLQRMSGWDLTEAARTHQVPHVRRRPRRRHVLRGSVGRARGAARRDTATLVPFTSEEGAGLDCEIGAPRLRNQRVFDWLDDVVR